MYQLNEIQDVFADITKISKELQWSVTTSFEKGIEILTKRYISEKQQGNNNKKFSNKK